MGVRGPRECRILVLVFMCKMASSLAIKQLVDSIGAPCICLKKTTPNNEPPISRGDCLYWAYSSDHLDFGTNPFKNWSSLPFLGLLLLVEPHFAYLRSLVLSASWPRFFWQSASWPRFVSQWACWAESGSRFSWSRWRDASSRFAQAWNAGCSPHSTTKAILGQSFDVLRDFALGCPWNAKAECEPC